MSSSGVQRSLTLLNVCRWTHDRLETDRKRIASGGAGSTNIDIIHREVSEHFIMECTSADSHSATRRDASVTEMGTSRKDVG